MTEPTDHHAAIATRVIRAATAALEVDEDPQDAIAYALIAIAYDLHRIANTLEQPADDQPGPGNAEADYTDWTPDVTAITHPGRAE